MLGFFSHDDVCLIFVGVPAFGQNSRRGNKDELCLWRLLANFRHHQWNIYQGLINQLLTATAVVKQVVRAKQKNDFIDVGRYICVKRSGSVMASAIGLR